jgi:peptidoglycan biosynthesis protein MviN/MurJ (putative lipid II flippase)
MDTYLEPMQPVRKYSRLAILSFGLGLGSALSPLLSFYFLVARNGGPGYVQSLFCGVPFAVCSLLTGIISLALNGWSDRPGRAKGGWMAVLGIVLRIFYFGIAVFLALVLLGPFLSGRLG